jgi:pimeloyl-ACP methyl ester carboxylesterase
MVARTIAVKAFDGTKLHVRHTKLASAKRLPIIFNDGLGCAGYAWKHIVPKLKKHHPVIEWNYRGHGDSEVPKDLGTMTIECLARDLVSVLNALGYDKAIPFGHSMGVQVALEAQLHDPERFAAHIFLCGGYKHPIATWHMAHSRKNPHTYTNFSMRELFPRITRALIAYPDALQVLWERLVLSEISYHATCLLEVNYRRINRDDFYPYFTGLGAMQAKVFAHMARSYAAHTGEPALAQIKVPTLIIGGEKDTFCPTWVTEDFHALVKHSELMMIPDGSHATPIEHPDLINLRVEKFLGERVLHSRMNHAMENSRI